MRLWHKDLIPYLPRQQLLGQWRECCAIAKSISEKGTPNHVLVNKVTDYPPEHFATYTTRIVYEMVRRGYRVDISRFNKWQHKAPVFECWQDIFPGWHNKRYLKQCLMNLQEKADCGAIPAEEWYRIADRWPKFI